MDDVLEVETLKDMSLCARCGGRCSDIIQTEKNNNNKLRENCQNSYSSLTPQAEVALSDG